MRTHDAAKDDDTDVMRRLGRRRFIEERFSMRVLATAGIVGIAVALGAILGARHVDGWLAGLVVGATTLALSAWLRSSQPSDRSSSEPITADLKGRPS